MTSPTYPSSELSTGSAEDAIALLKEDHQQVTQWLKEFYCAASNIRKQDLASKICHRLRVHVAIEDEIFLPALLSVTQEHPSCKDVARGNANARQLIDQILKSSPIDELFDSRLRLLGDLIAEHVEEEECPGGIFSEAAASTMDLRSLGIELQSRRQQLQQRQL
jgi:hypothetical protein